VAALTGTTSCLQQPTICMVARRKYPLARTATCPSPPRPVTG
jgi:hypothetical protein